MPQLKRKPVMRPGLMPTKISHLATLASLLLGCAPSTSRPPETISSSALMAACGEASWEDSVETPEYWPAGTFNSESDDFVRHWYSNQLCAMGELPLRQPPSGQVRIRLLWLRTYHPGIAVRIEHSPRGSRLVAIELDGAGGYEPGTIARRRERDLPTEEWDRLQMKLAQADFWQMVSGDPHVGGSDGAEWIIEVATHDRSHVVQRWAGKDIEPVGRLLLELSGLDPKPIY